MAKVTLIRFFYCKYKLRSLSKPRRGTICVRTKTIQIQHLAIYLYWNTFLRLLTLLPRCLWMVNFETICTEAVPSGNLCSGDRAAHVNLVKMAVLKTEIQKRLNSRQDLGVLNNSKLNARVYGRDYTRVLAWSLVSYVVCHVFTWDYWLWTFHPRLFASHTHNAPLQSATVPPTTPSFFLECNWNESWISSTKQLDKQDVGWNLCLT